MDKTNTKIKRLVLTALFSAMAYIAVFAIRIPAISFLSYEPKDVIIVIAGFMLGPLSAVTISLLVCVIEMVTISDTGWIGLLMNFLSSVAYAGIASLIYYKKKTIKSAVIGLIAGSIAMTIVMLIWNYIVTPIYMGVPREDVVQMLMPIFLPFNLVKSGINMAITLLIFTPLSAALVKMKIMDDIYEKQKKSNLIALYSISGILLATCIVFLIFV